MSSKENAVRVHDASLVNRVADAHKRARDYMLGTTPAPDARKAVVRKSVRDKIAAAKAMNDIADVITEAKIKGYSQIAAEGLINQGAGRAAEISGIISGPEASGDAPKGEIRIKSDGKGAVSLIGNAARNGSILRHRPSRAGQFLTRNDGTKKEREAYARQLAEIERGFSPLPDDHAGKRAEYNDVDDPDVVAAASYVIDGGEVFE